MEKKVVLITGASKGIGAATAIKFAQNNYDIILCYHTDYDSALKVKELIVDKYESQVLIIKVDISNEDSVKQMTKEVLDKFSKIDVLVNNAGIAIDTLYQDKTVDNFKKTIDTNLIGTFLVSKYIGDIMYNQKEGNIINVSSTNGIDKYFPMSLDYDASKAGIISLTHNLSLQYAPYIRVNCIAPGWVETENEMRELDDDYIKSEEQNIFLHRFAKPEEIANVIYFLSTEQASYINNAIIRVDGGTR